MQRDNYWTRRVRRRRILQGAGAGAVGLAGLGLVGCGGDDDGGGETPAATATATTAGAATSAPQATATPVPTQAPAGPKRGQIGVIQSAKVYETIDPHRTIASPVLVVLSRVQSKLLRFANPNTGELTGDVAETWESPDAQTVILNIREGVKWHAEGPGAENPAAAPGRDLTLDDIVYNIQRQKAGLLADGSKGSFGRKSYWSKVDTIDTSGNSITLKLTAPDATFIQGLANEFNLLVQKELIEAVEPDASDISADKVIGTGPNILTEWRPGKHNSVVRNPDYFLEDMPYLDGWGWVESFSDPTAYRIAFEQKQVDVFSDPDPGTTVAIHEANKEHTSIRYSGVPNTVAIYLPHLKEPWTDIRLVKAIHLATDRRQLIQQLHNGLGKVSGPVSWLQEAWAIPQDELESTPGYRLDKEADLKEARALWDAASGDEVGTITWVVPDQWAARAAWNSTPEIIAQMFNKAFNTDQFQGKVKTYGEIIPAWFSKDFDPFFGWIQNVEIPDARADLVAVFDSGSPQNIWGVNEPEKVDAKLAKALTLLDYEEAYALVREVQDLALENGQWGRVICYNYIAPGLRWNYLHNTGPSPEEGWNFIGYSKSALEDWIDDTDPSFEGRATPSIVQL